MERVTVAVEVTDPAVQAGVAARLGPRPELQIGCVPDPAVTLMVVESVDLDAKLRLRALHRQGRRRIVLVVTEISDNDLIDVIDHGVVGIVRRADATTDRVVWAILAAAKGSGAFPPDLMGTLLDTVRRRHSSAQTLDLAPKEVDVLRMLADGHSTNEIARTLCYSERTVKNVLHRLLTRNQLRNRTHAVAYAFREGVL